MLDVKFNDYNANQTNDFCMDVVNAIYDYYNDYVLKLDDFDPDKNGILDFEEIYNNDNTDISLFLINDCYGNKIYFKFKYNNIRNYYTLYSPEIGNIYDKHYCKKLYDTICKYIIDKEVI